MHVGHDVAPVDDQGRLARHAQGHVEHGPLLGGVDGGTGEHGVAALGHPGTPCHGDQGRQGVSVHPVLRVVEEEVAGGGDQVRAPVRVVGEQLAQVPGAEPIEVTDQVGPLGRCPHVDHCHVRIVAATAHPVYLRARRRSATDLRHVTRAHLRNCGMITVR